MIFTDSQRELRSIKNRYSSFVGTTKVGEMGLAHPYMINIEPILDFTNITHPISGGAKNFIS